MTTSNNHLSGWTKKKLQSTSQGQTCTKKNGYGHCLVVCCPSIHYSFLNPGETGRYSFVCGLFCLCQFLPSVCISGVRSQGKGFEGFTSTQVVWFWLQSEAGGPTR